MEITSLLSGYGPELRRAGETSPGVKKDSKSKTHSSDRVTVSAEAKQKAAASKLTAEEPIRREKVEEIKALIESGAYQIDTGKIAKRIVQEDPEFFLNKQSGA